jgi:membrane protease YdiL (CAAX protease family)
MKIKSVLFTLFIILWGLLLVWGSVYFNNVFYQAVSKTPHNTYLNDILSDLVLLFLGFMPVFWAPRLFGYQIGDIPKHWKLLLGLAIFFTGAPLIYRLIVGSTPFGANTWFFEGVVVPLAEESLFRGILFSLMLWGFSKSFPERTAQTLALVLSTMVFASAHLNNLGHYPTGFILFQVGFSIIVGLGFGYAMLKTRSIYPAFVLHALFNLAGTL